MTKKTKVWVTTAIAAVVTLLVVAGIIFIPKLFQPPIVSDKITSSVVGKNVTGLTSVNGEPASTVIIAPPTEDWWWILGVYSPNPVAYTLDFNTYKNGSKYIAYTTSPGGGFEAYGYLGLPTTFIIYESEDKAKANADLLMQNGVSHQLIGDTIFFVPEGAYSDVNYALNQYSAATEGEELDLDGKAMMSLQYSSLKTFMTKGMKPLDAETFDTLAGLLGVTTETSWSGTSSDGFNWEGGFQGLETSSVNTPTDVQAYLDSRSYFLDNEGNLKPSSEATDDNQSGIFYPGQSRIIGESQLVLQSNDDSTTHMDAEGNTEKAPLLKDEEGVYRITIADVNGLLASLLGDGVNYSYTTFESISVTIKKDGSSTINIVPDQALLDGTTEESADEEAPSTETTEPTETEAPTDEAE